MTAQICVQILVVSGVVPLNLSAFAITFVVLRPSHSCYLSLFCRDSSSSLLSLTFPLGFYNSSIEKPCAGSFWGEIGQMKALDGEPRFPKLYMLMAGSLSIPCSNADAE